MTTFYETVGPHLFSVSSVEALTSFHDEKLSIINSFDSLGAYFGNTTSTPSQSSLTAEFVDKPRKLLTMAKLNGHPEFKAYHKSEASTHTGLWLSAGLSKHPSLNMTDDCYVANLKLRLLQPIIRREEDIGLRCICGPQYLPINAECFHAFSCAAGKKNGVIGPAGVRYARHHQIRDSLIEFLGKSCPGATVFKEYDMPRDVALPLTADVAMRYGDDMYYFDVTVVNPCSMSHIKRNRVEEEPLKAAKVAENRKIQHYERSYCEATGRPEIPSQFFPFALESTGAYGPSALGIIEKLAGLEDAVLNPNENLANARRWFLKRVSVIQARARASFVEIFLSNVIKDANRVPNYLQHLPEILPHMEDDTGSQIDLIGELDDLGVVLPFMEVLSLD
jgi:hypothetical protein